MSNNADVQLAIIQVTGAHLNTTDSLQTFTKNLALYIQELIKNDFPKLIQILYRLDISEQKIKNELTYSPAEDAGKLIADLIIERQLQKIKNYQSFHYTDISEEEKW